MAYAERAHWDITGMVGYAPWLQRPFNHHPRPLHATPVPHPLYFIYLLPAAGPPYPQPAPTTPYCLRLPPNSRLLFCYYAFPLPRLDLDWRLAGDTCLPFTEPCCWTIVLFPGPTPFYYWRYGIFPSLCLPYLHFAGYALRACGGSLPSHLQFPYL